MSSFGIGLSALSAHSSAPVGDPAGDETATPALRRPRRRRSQTPVDTSGEDEVIAASYSRYSSEEQREESIADQQRKCREAAAANGHRLLTEFEYADEAVSGTKLRREGLDAMLRDAEAGEFQVLYFHSLSRLARESLITMTMLKQLVHRHGVRVISTSEGIDSAQDGWEIISSIMSILHERYVKELAENVFRGQEGAVLAGYAVGDHCFGYKTIPVEGSETTRRGRNSKPRKVYIVDDTTAPWVLRVFNWFACERRSLRWITRELNRRRAPKDHRSSTPRWHHQQVARLLANVKYVGSWPWGEHENVRDPLTGKLRQRERTEEECERWLRPFPHLRLIDDETFDEAQRLLDENIERHASSRRQDGTLAGSESTGAAPRHLLSRLIECGQCGEKFHVGGAMSEYLVCSTYRTGGLCDCKTQLRRDRATRLILEAIGKRILQDPAWFDAVFQSLLSTWREEEKQLPTALNAAESELAAIDSRISRLVDRIEAGADDPAIAQRLKQRQEERRVQSTRVDQLRKTNDLRAPEPSRQWLQNELRQLGQDLDTSTPAAADALRHLVDEKIVVTEIRREGRQRHHLQGRFTIKSESVKEVVAPTTEIEVVPESGSENALVDEIVIDFIDPSPLDQPADEAKRLYDLELLNKEIAQRMGVSKSQVTKLLKHWFESRGLEMPDGRSRRSSLKQKHTEPPLYQSITNEVMQLFNQQLLLGEIANRLGCDRNTITKAIEFWHTSRGLQVPDGRTRRKTLKRKAS